MEREEPLSCGIFFEYVVDIAITEPVSECTMDEYYILTSCANDTPAERNSVIAKIAMKHPVFMQEYFSVFMLRFLKVIFPVFENYIIQ